LLLPPLEVVVDAVGVAVTVTILEYAPTPASLILEIGSHMFAKLQQLYLCNGGEVFDVVAIVAIPFPSSRCTLIEIKLPDPKVVLTVH
jgi:hypothetical protein